VAPAVKRVAAITVVLAVLAVGLFVVGRMGLSYFQRHHTVDPTTALDDQCDDVPDGATRLTLTADDDTVLGAVLVGPEDATVGVVLRQGASQTICEWLPWAGEVAADTGAKVLLFDRRGRGSSPADGNLSAEPGDTLVAIKALRDSGVDEVAMVASSMGNSVMFSTVPSVEPAPCAVVSISPVLVSSDSQGVVDGSRLGGLPDNLWVTWEEGNPSIVDNARLIIDRAAGQGLPPVHELSVDTTDHSRQLVLNHPEAAAFVTDAVASCG
jgi:hypothetical protein